MSAPSSYVPIGRQSVYYTKQLHLMFNIACHFRDTLLSGKHKHYATRPIDIMKCFAIVLLKFNIYGG